MASGENDFFYTKFAKNKFQQLDSSEVVSSCSDRILSIQICNFSLKIVWDSNFEVFTDMFGAKVFIMIVYKGKSGCTVGEI